MNSKNIIKILFVILVILLGVNTIKLVYYLYPLKYSNSIIKYSEQYELDPYLVAAVINAESHYEPFAKSHKDAHGLMQMTESTAEWVAKKMGAEDFTIEMLYYPDVNIKMGCWYLDNLKEEFNGDVDLVLAAYNAGRGNVSKWLKDEEKSKDGVNLHYIPFEETDKYVKKVKVNYNIYKFLYKNDLKIE